jgi:gluconate 2-dehydrogenase gamma chain
MTDNSMNGARTRRIFLAELTRAGAASALAFQLPLLSILAGCARDTDGFVHLTAAEGRTMRAFAAQILPSEPGSPGAEEAGAVYFVDRAFGDPHFADQMPTIRAGLADLDARARNAGARQGFASLSDADQRAIMERIAKEPFFASARTLVLIGTFADSSHGGNRGAAGLKIVGMEHRPSYTAPYGWYDAQSSAERAESAA